LPWPAPVGPSTSSSIGRWAAKPTISQQIGVGVLLHKHAKHYHLVGHRWCLESGWSQQPDPTGESSLTTAKPLARYNAMGGALREQLRYRRATPSQGTRPRPGCGLSQTETSNRPSCAFRVRAFTAVSLFFDTDSRYRETIRACLVPNLSEEGVDPERRVDENVGGTQLGSRFPGWRGTQRCRTENILCDSASRLASCD
jgi:hypothetical protein